MDPSGRDPYRFQRERQRFQLISVASLFLGWFVTGWIWQLSGGNFAIFVPAGLVYFLGVGLLLWTLERRRTRGGR